MQSRRRKTNVKWARTIEKKWKKQSGPPDYWTALDCTTWMKHGMLEGALERGRRDERNAHSTRGIDPEMSEMGSSLRGGPQDD